MKPEDKVKFKETVEFFVKLGLDINTAAVYAFEAYKIEKLGVKKWKD